jgi:hypothetical protein
LLKLVNDKIAAITIIANKAASDVLLSNNKIAELEDTIDLQQEQLDDLTTKLAKGDVTARKASKAAIRAANSVEAHNRRWALRILGLKAPENQEFTAEAKQIAIDFFHDKLNVTNLATIDIDCAHRVGKVSAKGKQTLLGHTNLISWSSDFRVKKRSERAICFVFVFFEKSLVVRFHLL